MSWLADTAAPQRWIGSAAEDRRRLGDLFSARAHDDVLLRAASTHATRAWGAADSARLASGRVAVRALAPAVLVRANSNIPLSGNDGPLWAGRGPAALVRAGFVAERGPVRVVIAPEFVWAQNRAFDRIASEVPGRSPYASPFYAVPFRSADLPDRFGAAPLLRLAPGQSSVTVQARGVAAGLATENQWWGPGLQNAIVLSNNAEGFPHLFLRPAAPRRTRVGTWDARLLAGALTSSAFLDSSGRREQRAVSGLALTLRPALAPNLTVGLQRLATAAAGDGGALARHALDALVSWPSPVAAGPRSDALTGAFFRYRRPEEHVEVYGEWATTTAPRRLREFFVDPRNGQGFTVGLQTVRPIAWPGRWVRVQLEATNLEQSVSFQDRPAPPTFYTGRASLGGFTNRGQALGAWTGPGSSSQFLAADVLDLPHAVGQLGAYAVRVRWNNDALYTSPFLAANPFPWNAHDVSTYFGLRAVARLRRSDVALNAAAGLRRNYLFQNEVPTPSGPRTVDVVNLLLGATVTPR